MGRNNHRVAGATAARPPIQAEDGGSTPTAMLYRNQDFRNVVFHALNWLYVAGKSVTGIRPGSDEWLLRQVCKDDTLFGLINDNAENFHGKPLSQAFPAAMKKIVSYQAVEVHAGTIYKAAGWQVVGKLCDARPQRLPGSRQRATGPLQTKSRKQRWEIAI